MQEKYDRIGKGYNQTRKADPYLTERLFQLLAVSAGQKVLDIGCGSGNYTIALFKKGVEITGVDPSGHMLALAAKREAAINWIKGKVEALPLAANSFARIVASLTVHHWDDIAAGFRSLASVLRPNGKLVLFTATPEQMRGYWVGHYFPNMLKDSIVQMPTLNSLLDALTEAGFSNIQTEPYNIRPDLTDLFLYAGKERPALYLDPQVRQGISSFSDLSRKAEVDAGLKQLKLDIDSGHIKTIMQQYQHDKGDYLFMKAELSHEG